MPLTYQNHVGGLGFFGVEYLVKFNQNQCETKSRMKLRGLVSAGAHLDLLSGLGVRVEPHSIADQWHGRTCVGASGLG